MHGLRSCSCSSISSPATCPPIPSRSSNSAPDGMPSRCLSFRWPARRSTRSSDGANCSSAAARLGLYTFMYATIHVIIFVDLDYGLAWSLIVQTIIRKAVYSCRRDRVPLLIPLAFTSFDIWKKRLGKNWKRLHQLVYLIAPAGRAALCLGQKGRLLRPAGRDHPPVDLCG